MDVNTAMGETATLEFDTWLRETLVKLNTDDEIFSPYIKGILDTDDSSEEKTEALQGIISEITDNNIDNLCSEILAKWMSGSASSGKSTQNVATTSAIDNRLAELLEKQAGCASSSTPQAPTKEQAALKKAILAQYAEVSGDEEEDDDNKSGASAALVKNNNAASVDREVQEKREASKLEHKLKKDKDKEEREKQKSKAEERKDKEKKRTQKGERRR